MVVEVPLTGLSSPAHALEISGSPVRELMPWVLLAPRSNQTALMPVLSLCLGRSGSGGRRLRGAALEHSIDEQARSPRLVAERSEPAQTLSASLRSCTRVRRRMAGHLWFRVIVTFFGIRFQGLQLLRRCQIELGSRVSILLSE